MMRDRGLGPNAELIGQHDGLTRITTPALILRLDLFERNLARMAAFLTSSGLSIRPHAKTHKCSAIAQRQIEAGALGVSTATLREAEAMVAGGIAGVLITSPVVGASKIERLARLNGEVDGLMAVVDNRDNAEALANAARAAGKTLTVLVDIDIGMQRTGAASGEAVVELAATIAAADGLEFRGVQGYSGQVQHIADYAGRNAAYGAHLDRLAAMAAALTDAGIAPEIVTGGGTGTIGIDAQRRVINQHQAGSFVFMDVEYNLVEIVEGQNAAPFATALTMRNSVVSNNAAGFVTIDGGFKCFATDGPLPELHSGAPAGATYTYFGDEHGRVAFARDGETLALGAQVELVTPHCDPTVNLHDFIHVVRDGVIGDIWRIDARGVL
ncbi:MAG TPA: DSD1 family PLP-dependent enzyme [Alphaproteobacteria bacterium]|nr:DSD1 family PLP-dependent enzyme [Alphaproteobacteria bacterium]